MHVCLISNQIAKWGKIGGFGTATRALGKGLAQRGVRVSAVVPRRSSADQQPVEQLDGITVHGTGTLQTLFSGRVFRELKADIYHSQEPTIASRLAQLACPEAIHVVTCRDPRGLADHWVELRHTYNRRRVTFFGTWYYEASPPVKKAVRRATAVFTPAPTSLHDRILRLYGSRVRPEFVPSPVDLPSSPPKKNQAPTALFVGRWDPRKRLEAFFELAGRFPDVRFVAVGKAHDDRYDATLRKRYGGMPNVDMPGYVSRFADPGVFDFYGDAWVLVNTSAREGLPYTFIEAGGWGCAILSCLDPDRFASRFGYFVEDGNFDAGLRFLLENNRWRERGRAAASFVAEHFSERISIDEHLRRYRDLLARR